MSVSGLRENAEEKREMIVDDYLPPPATAVAEQLAGQQAATREAETRVGQAISRWEGEKVQRLRFRKELYSKCTEFQVCRTGAHTRGMTSNLRRIDITDPYLMMQIF